VDAQNKAGLTALHRAAIWGNVDGAAELLKHNASTTVRTASTAALAGETAAQTATRHGHTHVVELINKTVEARKTQAAADKRGADEAEKSPGKSKNRRGSQAK
jgi:ankyrin repeat protein